MADEVRELTPVQFFGDKNSDKARNITKNFSPTQQPLDVPTGEQILQETKQPEAEQLALFPDQGLRDTNPHKIKTEVPVEVPVVEVPSEGTATKVPAPD